MPRLVIQKGVAAGRDHALGGGECVVGRHPTCTFVLDDNLASRRHFRVVPEGGFWMMEDLGSTNGTLVNGQKASRLRLVDGDVIRVGGTDLLYVQKDLLAPSPRGNARGKPRRGDPPVTRRRRRRP